MDAIQIDLGIVHHISDGVYARQMMLQKNLYAMTHAHKYDHLSILASGRVMVEIDGNAEEFVAPACINIAAGKHHRVIALEDSVWFCIHATDETDPDKLDEVMIGG
jgi:quercetin dioxygenase-like cupin family protein